MRFASRGGTRVVLPVPGGACTTAAPPGPPSPSPSARAGSEPAKGRPAPMVRRWKAWPGGGSCRPLGELIPPFCPANRCTADHSPGPAPDPGQRAQNTGPRGLNPGHWTQGTGDWCARNRAYGLRAFRRPCPFPWLPWQHQAGPVVGGQAQVPGRVFPAGAGQAAALPRALPLSPVPAPGP
jgi:hypothetical protein